MKAEQIIVALDGMDRNHALMMAWTLSTSVWGFKISDLLIPYGLDIIRDLKCLGHVFVDSNLYAAPRIVGNSVIRLEQAGADFISVLASGGKAMIQSAVDNVDTAKIMAITTLASMSEATVQEVYCRSREETTWDLAHLAYEAGVHGIVCSPDDSVLLEHLNLMKVVQGISKNADLMIIGNEITKSSDPLETLQKIAR